MSNFAESWCGSESGEHTALHKVLMIIVAVVGKRIYRDASAVGENELNFYISVIHKLDQVFHDDIDTILMKISVIAETEQIQFETFALDHILTRDIVDYDTREIRLTGFGA